MNTANRKPLPGSSLDYFDARAAVEAMIEACRRGPLSARIDALDHREGTETDLLDRAEGGAFSVLPTV